MAAKTKKTPATKKIIEDYPSEHYNEVPTQHEYDGQGDSYEMARTNQPTSYINGKGWLLRFVPAGSMVACAAYYFGTLVEEGMMSLTEAREYASVCLHRGYKKVGKLFQHGG